MASDPEALQDEIARRTTQGWQVVSRDPGDAQMRRPKRFSLWWFLAWTILSLGTLFWVYLLWHWAKRDELIFLRMAEGQVVVIGERRGVFTVLFDPFGSWWRWAGGRQRARAKALAYGGPPVVAATVLIIILAVIGAAIGEDEQEAGTGSAAAQATATPHPTEEKIERIVPATPGAVAEARDVRITLNQIVDPWVDPSGFAVPRPDPGKRFVAFDVTIQYMRESGTHLACGTNFRLTDAESFAYDYELGLLFYLETHLDCIDLGGGQRTRGGLGFEVNDGTSLKLLKYDPDIFTTNDIEFQFQ